MPVDGCLNAPGLSVEVTITWSPHTIGEDQPRPGICVFHLTFSLVDHRNGSPSIADTPRPAGPRNCGQVISTGVDRAIAAPTTTASIHVKETAMRMRAVYT